MGDFLFNSEYKDSVIACRRSTRDIQYEVCGYCKGYYSKTALWKHIPKCNKNDKSNIDNCQVFGRRIRGDILPIANRTLKEEVFPVLRDDSIVNIIRYDKLAIIYGNKMCDKYRHKHHYTMIRNKLRLFGRLLTCARVMNKDVTDLISLLHPKFLDTAIHSINQKELKSTTEDFLKVLEEEFSLCINKTVVENQLEQQRKKKHLLPNTSDIRRLSEYLKRKRVLCVETLQQQFTFQTWKELLSSTLVGIQVFNRRRAGEVERMLIEDFHNTETMNTENDSDIYNFLSEIEKQSIQEFSRITLRGKLARGVPVLIDKEMLRCIQIILKKREEAGVLSNNPFVFGLPGHNKYLRACKLLREYSILCGAKNPELLRGTQLRKHIATKSAIMNLPDNEVEDLANFMGHAEKIHKQIYRLPRTTNETREEDFNMDSEATTINVFIC
ncbi:hypothetical protein FQR65_LT16184 [Abscondita terminalis]|nr:hypothetical protein FQR65_LT16184 [Abscondita terminalis]